MSVLVDLAVIKKCIKEVRTQVKNWKSKEKKRLKRIKKHLSENEPKRIKKVKTSECATQTEPTIEKKL